MIRDPYLQIITAQMILVISLTLQALGQPYHKLLLNVLDVVGLLVLVMTQVLSIVYFYLDNLESERTPDGFDNDQVRITITVLLFILNCSVIVVLFAAWILQSTLKHVYILN